MRKWIIYLLFIVVILVLMFFILYVFFISFMSGVEVLEGKIWLLFFLFENYWDVFEKVLLFYYLINSFVVFIFVMVG